MSFLPNMAERLKAKTVSYIYIYAFINMTCGITTYLYIVLYTYVPVVVFVDVCYNL